MSKHKVRDSIVFRKAADMLVGDGINVEYNNAVTTIVSVVDSISSKEHFVNIRYDEDAKVIKVTCSCTLQSLKSKHLPLCSHIVAAVNKITSEHLGTLRIDICLNQEEVNLLEENKKVSVNIDGIDSNVQVNLSKSDEFGSVVSYEVE